MASEIRGHSVSIVLVGKFNPAIFSPAWFAARGLISEEEAGQAELGVVHPQIADFKIVKFNIRVDPERFQISTTLEPFVEAADWVKLIFGQYLPHTPIFQSGINYNGHFAADSAAKRHNLGRALAPLAPWGEWGKELDETQALEEKGGLRSLAMLQSKIPGRKKGYRQVNIEPSVRGDIVNTSVGVFMNVNDHFEAPDVGDVSCTRICVEWLSNFDESLQTAKSIIKSIREYSDTL